MDEKIKAARQQLGRFFQDRRRQIGRTAAELAEHLGISAETVKGVETGRFACDIDLLFKFCEALEIKPFFAPHEEIKASPSFEKLAGTPKFLFAPDHEAHELYILHTQYPACLIHVIQTVPVTFRIVNLYDEIDESELATHHFLEDAKKFWREYGSKYLNEN